MTVLILVLGLGYLGWLHPAGDSFAVFRVQAATALATLATVCLVLRNRLLGEVGLVVATLAGAPLLLDYQQAGVAGDWRLYQKNMLFRNDDLPGLEADIRAMDPDVLTLQEVSSQNQPLLAALADVLPGQVYCPFLQVGGTAVATRWPVVAGSETCTMGLSALQAEMPAGRVWLVSIHMHWPWPYRQTSHLQSLLPVLQQLEGPVVVAGDFNMVPWSAALAAIRAAARVKPAGPVRGTFPEFGPLFVLPIDQVMAPGGASLELRPLFGSDHRGLLARFDF